MNRHVEQRVKVARLIAESSPCPRGQVGAVIFRDQSWVIVSDGYNGPPRGGGHLCGGESCHRVERGIASGERCEIGCHHAEINALINAVRQGASTLDAHMISTRDPCLMCAKSIHHSGIARIYVPDGTSEGCAYLRKHKIEIELFDS